MKGISCKMGTSPLIRKKLPPLLQRKQRQAPPAITPLTKTLGTAHLSLTRKTAKHPRRILGKQQPPPIPEIQPIRKILGKQQIQRSLAVLRSLVMAIQSSPPLRLRKPASMTGRSLLLSKRWIVLPIQTEYSLSPARNAKKQTIRQYLPPIHPVQAAFGQKPPVQRMA